MIRTVDKYVKNTVNYRIIQALISHPDKWMTAVDVARICGYSNSRSIAHRLTYIIDDIAGIEYKRDTATFRYLYRYNLAIASELTAVPMGRIGA